MNNTLIRRLAGNVISSTCLDNLKITVLSPLIWQDDVSVLWRDYHNHKVTVVSKYKSVYRSGIFLWMLMEVERPVQ